MKRALLSALIPVALACGAVPPAVAAGNHHSRRQTHAACASAHHRPGRECAQERALVARRVRQRRHRSKTSAPTTSKPVTTAPATSGTPTTTTPATTSPTTTTTTTATTPAPSVIPPPPVIGPGGSNGLSFSNVGAYSLQVGWTAAAGAASVQVSVDGQMVDQFAASGDDEYTLSELWPSTAFTITVTQKSSTGLLVGTSTGWVTTAAATGAFPRLYSDSTFINQLIGTDPTLDPNSSTITSQAISAYSSSANLVDSAQWGIPIVTADSQSSMYSVGCEYYWCNVGVTGQHIPADAQTSTGSDGHLAVLQPSGQELDMWIGQHSGSTWTAGERWVESAAGSAANCTTVHACGGADAANFALAAGVVRPQEIAQGHIDHALVITDPDTRQGYIACPATNGDGTHTNAGALPIGAHVQLNPNVDVAALNIPAWQKVIAVALQQYGAYVSDTGGTIGIYAQSDEGLPYDAWAKAGIPSNSPSLADLPWNQMQVLGMTQCG